MLRCSNFEVPMRKTNKRNSAFKTTKQTQESLSKTHEDEDKDEVHMYSNLVDLDHAS